MTPPVCPECGAAMIYWNGDEEETPAVPVWYCPECGHEEEAKEEKHSNPPPRDMDDIPF